MSTWRHTCSRGQGHSLIFDQDTQNETGSQVSETGPLVLWLDLSAYCNQSRTGLMFCLVKEKLLYYVKLIDQHFIFYLSHFIFMRILYAFLTGEQTYGAIEYKGTWFVTDDTASDYIGFVFGYVNNRKFYIVKWIGQYNNYDGATLYRAGIKGVQLKV